MMRSRSARGADFSGEPGPGIGRPCLRSAALAVVLAFGLACGATETTVTDDTGDASLLGDAAGATEATAAPPMPVVPVPAATKPRDVAVLDVEGFGEIRVELLPELAPETVANFTKLAEADAFDDTTFHRVIPGFMVQGGDPNTKDDNPDNDGTGGPGYTIADEFSEVSFLRGIVAMANTGRPNTAGSQFFILHDDSRHLDGKYTAFGQVIAGIDHVDAITRAPIDAVGRHGPRDRPREDIVVADVRIERGAGLVPGKNAEAAASAPTATTTDPKTKEWDEG